VSWARIARFPAALGLRTGIRQAKRLKLTGPARVVILYDPLQTMLALGLIARYPEAELWYLRAGGPSSAAGPDLAGRAADLEALARRRATLEMSVEELAPLPPERTWFDANEPLWDRLEALEIVQFAD
jgi:hypothetical protein